jgi:K+-sensing histidine kinase KdpD
MDLELFQAISKYPFLNNDIQYDTVELVQNKTCLKCKEKDCIDFLNRSSDLEHYVCSKDYDNLAINIGEIRFVLNGLIFKSNKKIPIGRKEVRKEWIVDEKDVHIFSDKIRAIESNLVKRANETTEKNFSIFHDFKTSMKIFFTCTQDIINKLPGTNFEEKLKNSESSYQDLYHSLRLISSQLGMIDVIMNPESISFGSKREINVYKLFDKVRILFGHLSEKKRDIDIEIVNPNDRYVRNSMCYDSIEFIPLILLDNALKYSAPFSTIEIELTQHYNKVKIKVKNIGPLVSDENTEKIFEKFFRDDSGKNFAKEGIGIGLWVAKQILVAHGSNLTYNKDYNATGKIGLNIFEFELPTL